MSGVVTVMWKEWHDQFWRGKPSGQLWQAMITPPVMGLFVLLFIGRFLFVEDGAPPIYALGVYGFLAMFSILAPLGSVVDAVAGERERHTLESLLATPISDSAIATGKLLLLWIVGVASGLVGAIVVSIALPVLFGPAFLPIALIGPVITLLVSALPTFSISALGILISLSAESVKAGQQRLLFIVLPFTILPGILVGAPGLLGLFPTVGASLALLVFAAVAGTAVLVLPIPLLYARMGRERLLTA